MSSEAHSRHHRPRLSREGSRESRCCLGQAKPETSRAKEGTPCTPTVMVILG